MGQLQPVNKTAEGGQLLPDASIYDSSKYKKASNTVDICICKMDASVLKILLIKRKYPPFADKWALPGGFVDIDKNEGLSAAAQRELLEETGVSGVPVRQLKTYGDDPFRDPRERIISTVYFALLGPERAEKLTITAGDDAREASWFPITKNRDLAFDHKLILRDLRLKISHGIFHFPYAFELAPNKFTWSQLRQIFETVLNKRLIAQNFPRDIQRFFSVQELSETFSAGRGKPAQLFQYSGVKSPLA